jgi:Tetratricopeptide repeat
MRCVKHSPILNHRAVWGAVVLVALTLGFASPTLARAPAPAPASSPASIPSDVLRAQARKIFVQGQTHYKLGRFAKALLAYTRAYQLLPLAGFLFNIGQCHRLLGHYKRAIHFYRGYLRETPGAPNLEVVKILIARTEKKLAAQSGRRVRAQAEFTEGVRLYALGQVRQGLAKFRAAYQVLPSTGYRYHIAQCHRKLKEWKQAVFYYEGYLRDNPGTPMASLVEAYLKECRQRVKEAELKRRGILNPTLGGGGAGGTGTLKVVPLYKKWWLWTVVAVGVTALAVGLGAGLGLRDQGGIGEVPTTLGTVSWR